VNRDSRFLEVELTDEEAPFEWPPATRPITADRRLQLWAETCTNGSVNVITAAGVVYSWDAHPRRLQNGALQGRVYAQPAGEMPRDVGGFKIDARGRVINLPEVLRSMLPGGLEAIDNGENNAC
jgi:hypothetical protein